MTRLKDIIEYIDATLGCALVRDYGPNGLQVEGRKEVRKIVTGVSASLALFERASQADADLIITHHGLIWGSGLERITGTLARRLAVLFQGGISLAAYHLPLDQHETLGNNAGLADALGLPRERHPFIELRGREYGFFADLPEPVTRRELLDRVTCNITGTGQAPPFVFAHGPELIRRIGVCSGGAGEYVESAARVTCDAYVTGELAERSGELARELGITMIAAGHYATESFGPKRLAYHVGATFPDIITQFIDVPSPL